MANKRRPRRVQVRAAVGRPADKSIRLASTSYSPRFVSILRPLSAVFHPSLSLLIRLLISVALLALLLLMKSYAEAQENTQFNHAGFPAVDPPAEPPTPPPFVLPFASPPGPGTWLLGQPYGSTVGAYMQRKIFYQAGQGLHFGLDLSAPCGTEVVAIGDGIVSEVDKHGSPPHSLMIDHPNGYSSLYGHFEQKLDLLSMQLWAIDVPSGQMQPLTDPASLSFSVSNGDWDVSPDGRQVIFVNSADNNIWLITLL